MPYSYFVTQYYVIWHKFIMYFFRRWFCRYSHVIFFFQNICVCIKLVFLWWIIMMNVVWFQLSQVYSMVRMIWCSEFIWALWYYFFEVSQVLTEFMCKKTSESLTDWWKMEKNEKKKKMGKPVTRQPANLAGRARVFGPISLGG